MNANITALILLGLIVLAIFLTMRLTLFMTKRAICKVLGIFRENNAYRYESAVPLEQIGLTDRPKFFGFGLRDYKPYVIQALTKANVLQKTPDERYFLSEKEEKEFEIETRAHCKL